MLDLIFVNHCKESYNKRFNDKKLKFSYRLKYDNSLIYLYDLRMKVEELVKFINSNRIVISIPYYAGLGAGKFIRDNIEYYFNSKEKGHDEPHVHIRYKEENASIALFDQRLLAGSLSPKIFKKAQNVIKNQQQSLLFKWNTLTDGRHFELGDISGIDS